MFATVLKSAGGLVFSFNGVSEFWCCRMALEAAQSAKDKEWMTHSRVSYEVMRKVRVLENVASPES